MADQTAATLRPRPRASFEFADLVLDTGQSAVFRDGERLPLPKLSYALLLALVEAAPDLLSHDALADRVWGGRLVTPETLTQRVQLLRRALGDDASAPRYLRVVRGLGFQLVPPVAQRRGPAAPAARAVNGHAPEPGELAGDIDLSLPAQPSIVVLPFDAGTDPAHREFAEGLAHDVTTRIARTRSLFVIARGTAFRFAPGAHDARELSRMLGVRYVVQGHVRFDGPRMRVDVGLADAVEGREIWADGFQRRPEDVFETQEEIADLIVGAISAEVELAERQRAFLDRSASLDAWSAYHRGCWHMYRFTPEDLDRAEQCFAHSAALDPKSPRTFAGLSFVHWQRAFLEIAPDRPAAIRRAFDLALQSVSLNPHDPLGRWALGRAHQLRGEMDDAIAELGVATELNPSFAIGQYSLGFALLHMGDNVRSLALADKARRLSPYDPLGFAMTSMRGFSLAMTGNPVEGARHLAAAARRPNAHIHIVAMAAVCDALAGDDEAGRRDYARVLEARPGYDAKDFLRAFPLQREEQARLVEQAFHRLARLR